MIGIVEGSDPALRQDYVVMGGHMDHCGSLGAGYYPGANDNASGTAVAMEIGRAMALLDRKPKRSVVIALFGGEEMGLKGSEYFVTHLPGDLGKPAAMVNFDMAGEGEGAACSFSPEPAAVKRILDEAEAVAKTLKDSSPLRPSDGGSDFAPFMAKGIPALTCSSNGPHQAYHQLGDTIYRINPDVMADIARLGYLAAFKLADQ
ncbi:MAG TPA: M20/M25/M40 family metallo-hydrolase [Vicinamibacterales bacterium]